MKKFVFFILLAIIIPIASQAYVMPGKQMIEMMIKNMGATSTLSVEHAFNLHNPDLNTSPLALQETVIYQFPDAMHSEILMNDKQKLHIVSPRGTITIIDSIISEDPHTTFDLYKYLLLERDKTMITRRLKVSGIDINVSSYGKFEKRAVYVIGARYPDMSVPQLWLELNTFRPCRWIVTPNNYGQSLEIVYRNWIEITKDVWYPDVIEYIQDTHVLVEIKRKSLKINPELTNDLFDVSYHRQMYPSQSSYGSPYESDMDEVNKTIRDFQRAFE